MPTLADYAEHDAHEKAKRKKTHRGAKKRQKAHSTTWSFPKGKNIMVFTDNEIPVSNPVDAESRETLFIPDSQGYNYDDVKVNPKHSRAWFYQLLMDCYKQDPSGKSFKRIIDLYLDAPSDREQDSSDEEMGDCLPCLKMRIP